MLRHVLMLQQHHVDYSGAACIFVWCEHSTGSAFVLISWFVPPASMHVRWLIAPTTCYRMLRRLCQSRCSVWFHHGRRVPLCMFQRLLELLAPSRDSDGALFTIVFARGRFTHLPPQFRSVRPRLPKDTFSSIWRLHSKVFNASRRIMTALTSSMLDLGIIHDATGSLAKLSNGN